MTQDWSQTKAGDEVYVPRWGKVKLSRPAYPSEARPGFWIAPGYRWIKSRQKFSGTALENVFRPDADMPPDRAD